ncbi:nose resistant to fluoxetine protein 6-like isoform X2 [Cryptotermes secundus]|uniref:nose resistant to fluoxetine protein 6-like isoform X2 n=1 Tax=Cryptotermes secundus TaxID=105785 RepID=UPI001454BD2F|nr:nose resistant to fluoxetine protein 6-like isoform X2 [Cryptotermes secundus]
MIVIQRYIRLSVVYAVAVAFGATWYIHMSEGPMWNSVVGTEAQNCRRNWWINLLYLNNYYKVEEMCMPQSWYLAADFQCHVVATLLVVVVWKHPRYAKAVLAGVLFASVLTSFIQTYVEGLNPLFLLYPQTGKQVFKDKTFQRAHITFHRNFGAYLIGVIFGYIYHNTTHTSVKWTKVGHCVMWLVAITALVFTHLISTVFYQPSYKHNSLIASLYGCSYSIIIAAAIGTILTSCALGHGGIINRIASSKPFQILGRLYYCMYLIHFYVIAVQISSKKEPFDISGPWLEDETASSTEENPTNFPLC